jgi:hypothetical protein
MATEPGLSAITTSQGITTLCAMLVATIAIMAWQTGTSAIGHGPLRGGGNPIAVSALPFAFGDDYFME